MGQASGTPGPQPAVATPAPTGQALVLIGGPAVVQPQRPVPSSLPSLRPAVPVLGHTGGETRLDLSVGTRQAQEREGWTPPRKDWGRGSRELPHGSEPAQLWGLGSPLCHGAKQPISSATVSPHDLWDRPGMAPREPEDHQGTDSERT